LKTQVRGFWFGNNGRKKTDPRPFPSPSRTTSPQQTKKKRQENGSHVFLYAIPQRSTAHYDLALPRVDAFRTPPLPIRNHRPREAIARPRHMNLLLVSSCHNHHPQRSAPTCTLLNSPDTAFPDPASPRSRRPSCDYRSASPLHANHLHRITQPLSNRPTPPPTTRPLSNIT
jgi:hypothetical protein